MFLKGLCIFFLLFTAVVKAQSEEDPITSSASSDEVVTDDEAEVEDEKIKKDIVTDITGSQTSEAEEQTIVDGVPVGSKNVAMEMMFVEPALGKRSSGAGVELPANKLTSVLVIFKNNEFEIRGETPKNYKLLYLEGFLRYPSEYSYFLQNFTAKPIDINVEPKREATLDYSFVPALQLAGRPFGLTLRMSYQDNEEKLYTTTFFNDTIQIIELDEGFDTESLFLYVLVVAVFGLSVFGLYHIINVYALRKLKITSTQKPTTDHSSVSLKSEVDLQWVPKEHLRVGQSPTLSPRKRKSRRQEDNHLTGGH